MSFSEKLTEIMQIRNITAQDISKASYKNISVSNVRSFQNGTNLPNSNQVRHLNKIFGLDFELFLNESKPVLEPVKSSNTKTEFAMSDKKEKPGNKKVATKIKNKSKVRLHDIKKPEKKHCRRCNIETGTERFAHYEGYRKPEFGKGIGIKCNDNMTAWLCQRCTDTMDKKPNMDHAKNFNMTDERKSEILNLLVYIHSEEWLYLIVKTWLM